MSKAYDNFMIAIRDSENILDAYDRLNKDRVENRDPEELKRAALIMTLTAWGTYVEDRVKEEVECRLKALEGSQIATYIRKKLEVDLKTFHTPNSQKTKHIFEDFAAVDVTEHWEINGNKPDEIRAKLNKWIKKRGDAVHRSVTDKQNSHLVSRDDMKKCINFFKQLVKATDSALHD